MNVHQFPVAACQGSIHSGETIFDYGFLGSVASQPWMRQAQNKSYASLLSENLMLFWFQRGGIPVENLVVIVSHTIIQSHSWEAQPSCTV